MKISIKTVRRIIREEVLKEIAGSGLPPAAKSFQEIPALQKGYNDLVRMYSNVLIMQGIVQNNPGAAQMPNAQLDQIAGQYSEVAKTAAANFQQKLAALIDSTFKQDLASLPKSQAPAQAPAQKPATGTAFDQRQTMPPPRM